MTEETKTPKPELTEYDRATVELAYEIISRYVDHAQLAGLVIGTMAARLGEEGVKPIAESDYWKGYMTSRRYLQAAKEDIERLSRLLDKTLDGTR